jgi:hypothetical protein
MPQQVGGCPLRAHPEFVAAFDAGLRGGPLPPGVTARDPAEAPRRFAVYRNNVAHSLSEALAARFPVIRRLVGEEFFKAMAVHYAEAERPLSPVLQEWGGGFPAFLDAFPPLASYPYMADVARIEIARGRAFHAADAVAADPADLAGADPARLILPLHPAVSVLRLSSPAVSVWSANQPGATPPALMPAGSEIALIYRDTAFEVPVIGIGQGDAVMIETLIAGSTLLAAADAARTADPAHDPQPMLVRLVAAGAILTPKGDAE